MVVAVSTERYRAICDPLKHRQAHYKYIIVVILISIGVRVPRFFEFQLVKKRNGNWSGTGAGNRLSAVLGSRVIDSSLTVVLCPNPVVEGWANEISLIYPDSEVITKPNRLILNQVKIS